MKRKKKNQYAGINTWDSRTDQGGKQQIFSNNLTTLRLELGLAVKLRKFKGKCMHEEKK